MSSCPDYEIRIHTIYIRFKYKLVLISWSDIYDSWTP